MAHRLAMRRNLHTKDAPHKGPPATSSSFDLDLRGPAGEWHAPTMADTMSRIPFVDYLELEPTPHLVAHECSACGARYFDHRIACANCEATEFRKVDIPTEGEVRAFTIVSLAAPGIPVPFVAAVVDCGGTSVKGNIINTPPDPDHVKVGMKVRLATESVGVDDDGVEAVNYGFEPC